MGLFFPKRRIMHRRGFVLLGLLLLMVLLAVTAIGLNRRAGLQNRMAANQVQGERIYLSQKAVTEQAVWQLTGDPCRRTSESGESYEYGGLTYKRKVRSSTVSGRTDSITVAVTYPGGTESLNTSYRYYIHPPITGPTVETAPYQVSRDSANNIYFADPNHHQIFKRDAVTGETTVVAGTGESGFSGDGGQAAQAKLDNPRGVFVTSGGFIYIADTENHRVRKVDASGVITTAAGTGTGGYSGDSGPAAGAQLNKPTAVDVDGSGNIYIADTDNHRVRKVDASGIITTIAGTGTAGYNGDSRPAITASLNKPCGVFESWGWIYIADTENNRIRRIAPSKIIFTAAGTGTGGYSGDGGTATSAQINKPWAIAYAGWGGFYIADTDNHRVRQVDGLGIITTAAGTGLPGYTGDGGPAVSARLDKPKGLCLDGLGQLILADTNNNRLRQVDSSGIITSLLTSGGLGLDKARQIALDSAGNLYIADTNNNQICKLSLSGQVSTAAGTGSAGYSGDSGPAVSAKLNKPSGVTVDSAGNIYIADTDNHRIRKVNTGGIINAFAGTGVAGYSAGGSAPPTVAKINGPMGIYAAPSGNIYFADTENHLIRAVNTSGFLVDVAGNRTQGFSGDGGPATLAQLNRPQGIFVTASGNMYIADTDNHRVRKVDASGVITTVAGNGTAGYSGDGGAATSASLKKPTGVFADGNGNLFIADQDNHLVRIVCAQGGKISTLAGTGSGGFNGDDQPAITAKLRNPYSVVMAAQRGGRKIFISDTGNNRVRLLTFEIDRELY